MKYNDLQTTKSKSVKRVGRGIASGRGKTAGRGTKGQNSRTGSSSKPGFSGGQNPLMQQLPKLPGFKSHRLKSELVYTDQLEKLKHKDVDANVLYDAKLVSSPFVLIKLLDRGEVTKQLSVKLPAASQNAVSRLQQVGGEFVKTPRLSRPKTSKKT